MTTGGIQSAQITYKGLNKGPYPVVLRHPAIWTRPFTLDEATGSNDIIFVGRASIQTVASSIFANDFRSALGVRSNDDRYSAGVLRDRAAIRRDARHRRSNSAPLAAPPIRCCRRPIIRFTSAAMSARCRSRRRSAAFARSPCTTVRGFARSHRDPQHRRVGHGREPGKRARRFLGSSSVGGYQNLFAQADYYHIDVDRSGLISQ